MEWDRGAWLLAVVVLVAVVSCDREGRDRKPRHSSHSAAGLGPASTSGYSRCRGKLVLNLEDVRQLLVVPTGPQRKVVTHANKLGIDPQLLPAAQYGTLQNVICLQLSSCLPYCAPCP